MVINIYNFNTRYANEAANPDGFGSRHNDHTQTHRIMQTHSNIKQTHTLWYLPLKKGVFHISERQSRESWHERRIWPLKKLRLGVWRLKKVYLITPMLVLGVGALQWLIAWLQLGLRGFLAVWCCQNLPQVSQVQGRLIKMIWLKKINAI